MAGLKAIREQTAVDAERIQMTLDISGNQPITVDMIGASVSEARNGSRLEGGGYRWDHLRAFVQRVEVADTEVSIMGSKSELLRTLVTVSGGRSAAFGVHSSVLNSSVLKWRARKDSNL